ncbi:TPA: hypothetical protein DIU27_04720 [Candidatus Collierbacteria bacterium]|nr:MAG: hypothetical protein UW31_C0016G0018 [Candidatus Collierbacteria bacterium GW2011_GWA2_44_13]KKT65478.1 MAG: hypothetical protein UW58_C0029G0018 [Candidatus Collierbacteria bacterium GW2011_GWC2_44_30]KKT87991.1 MAG: hypothetical protein UW88_C0017G0012 [Candidatus Collierbacteria bacterium GW2011_GWD2_45_10]HCQ31652.1 hypothetical protein [Candidatus Collierbacteria bacterium]
MRDYVIYFSFEGKHFYVPPQAYDLGTMILPDGRAIVASGGWLESLPPQPSGLVEVPHLFKALPVDKIAKLMNAVLAIQYDPANPTYTTQPWGEKGANEILRDGENVGFYGPGDEVYPWMTHIRTTDGATCPVPFGFPDEESALKGAIEALKKGWTFQEWLAKFDSAMSAEEQGKTFLEWLVTA